MLGGNPLFRESIESLICQEMEAEIVGRETSIERAFQCITTMQPDVIVVDGSDPDFDHGKVVSSVMELGLTAKVIGLNLNDNRICIYRGEQKIAREVNDLVEAIRM
jgi:chemotaxis response regulator CheB